MAVSLRLVLLLPLVLGGCKLIDQTTFDPDAAAEAAPPAVPAPAWTVNQVALISIRFDTDHPSFHEQLDYAVHAAEARKPGRGYDIVGVSTAAEATKASQDSLTVMEAMHQRGIAMAQLHLGARIDPAQTVREVRVYLR